MRLNSIPIAQASMFSFMGDIGRALFKPAAPCAPSREAEPAYWKVMYIDENGVLRRSTVRIITLHADMRRLTVWCDALGRECILKISRIVEANDLQSGRKINLHRWMVGQQKPSA